ncbi:hypothetical protein GCM10009627_02640 [Curtobacterium herbarum]|uniref:Uncharacterized protein n=1 Tax=Curtobacterium herbarum TaxID=150122 RepID=A0ABN1Z8M7_9MICO
MIGTTGAIAAGASTGDDGVWDRAVRAGGAPALGTVRPAGASRRAAGADPTGGFEGCALRRAIASKRGVEDMVGLSLEEFG